MLPCPSPMQEPQDSGRPPQGVLVQHQVAGFSDRWIIEEEPVPESAWHSETIFLLRAVLRYWVEARGRNAVVFANLAVRVSREEPRMGFAPDLMIVEPAPPGAPELTSLRLWEPGHVPPAFVIEVVSPGHPHKDYVDVPDQCAAAGVRELVIFDPLLAGPRAHGGPYRLQVWRRTELGVFARAYAGEGPFASEFLGAYLVPVADGRRLRVASDEAGKDLWPTDGEARARAEVERARAEVERARAEAERALAEARVAELEAELARRGPR